MRRVLRRFKDSSGKEDSPTRGDSMQPTESTQETDASNRSTPLNSGISSLSLSGEPASVPTTPVNPTAITEIRTSNSLSQENDDFSAPEPSSSLSHALSQTQEVGRPDSLYSEASSLADNSLFSKVTRSTAPSTFASGGFASKRIPEERIQVVETEALAESHDKANVPISTSPIETRPRDIPSLSMSGMAPVSAPITRPEPLVGSFGQSGRIAASSPPSTVLSEHAPRADLGESSLSIDAALAALESKVSSLYATVDLASAPRVAGIIAQLLTDFSSSPLIEGYASAEITMQSSANLRSVVRSCLGISDNLLRLPIVRNAKAHLHRALYRLGTTLGLVEKTLGTVPYPRNWALGTSKTPDDEIVCQLMDKLATTSSGIVEQEGAYVAPVLRGFSPQFAVSTVCFGIPGGDEAALGAVTSLQRIIPSVHIYGRNDYLRTCAGNSSILPPFRRLENAQEPPMSISIATERAGTISGTLGGYLYPIIEDEDDEGLSGHTFAVTCGHVCLNAANSSAAASVPQEGERNALVPSPVLVQMFRKALVDERNKHEAGSIESIGYQQAISELDQHPPKKLGPVVWGERTVINGTLSDLSIVKCNRDFVCENKLGNDLNLSQYDPGLMFSNLAVTEVVSKAVPGMPVFKYGSTSRYTNGNTSAARIVYWSSGKVQSSEFVVNSDQPVFATGGDSGAWILTKARHGLGVVGMLHSYDGEMKEFGLYTPMETILSRLEQVTGVPWRVVGVTGNKDVASDSVPATL